MSNVSLSSLAPHPETVDMDAKLSASASPSLGLRPRSSASDAKASDAIAPSPATLSHLGSVYFVMEEVKKIFEATESVLSSLPFTNKITLGHLVEQTGKLLHLSKEETHAMDPIVRFYARMHPEWMITIGKQGGAVRKAALQSIADQKMKALAVKQEIRAMINEKIASIKEKPEAQYESFEVKNDDSLENGF